jgi:hypothetical protein
MEEDFELFRSVLEKHGLIEKDSPADGLVCAHLVVVEETCVHCHERIADRSNFERPAIKRRFGSCIAPDLENRGFPDSVVEGAQKYFSETQANSPAFRGKMRTAIVAACVYHSLLKLGAHASFGTVSKRFGIEKKVASKGFQRVKMYVGETRNQFETPKGVAKWIAESICLEPTKSVIVVQAIDDRFAQIKLSPALLRASVAAAMHLTLGDHYSCENIANAADASLKKVLHLSALFKKR